MNDDPAEVSILYSEIEEDRPPAERTLQLFVDGIIEHLISAGEAGDFVINRIGETTFRSYFLLYI